MIKRKQAVKIVEHYVPIFSKRLRLPIKSVTYTVISKKDAATKLQTYDCMGWTWRSIYTKTVEIHIVWDAHDTEWDLVNTLLHESLHAKFRNLRVQTHDEKRRKGGDIAEEVLVNILTPILLSGIFEKRSRAWEKVVIEDMIKGHLLKASTK